jgi:hypothetical protein
MPSLISLVDQFEQMDRALTADELAQLLAVSHVTIFKLSKVSGIAPAFWCCAAILAQNRHLLQCRRCQAVFERTNPCTPKSAPFRSS